MDSSVGHEIGRRKKTKNRRKGEILCQWYFDIFRIHVDYIFDVLCTQKDYDSEGSLKDFVVHSSDESDDSDSEKSDNSIVSVRSGESNKEDTSKRRLTRAKKKGI